MERTDPKKSRVPNRDVIALRVANDLEKRSLLALDPEKIFTEPHHNGYPAVLVRLSSIEDGLLEDLLTAAWRCQTPKRLAAQLEESR